MLLISHRGRYHCRRANRLHRGEMTQPTNFRSSWRSRDPDPRRWPSSGGGTPPHTAKLFTKRGTKMSVEATALSRSKLEQKDRAELATIVEAMGGKAGSRAKKADLVEQALQLPGEGNNDKAAEPRPEARVEPERAEAEPDDEPPADWELGVAAD